MKTTTAVILVAGIGSRLRPITDDRPKALVDLGGETILGRAVRLLAELRRAKSRARDGLPRGRGAGGDAGRAAAPSSTAKTPNSIALKTPCRSLCVGAALGADAFFKLDGDVVFQRQVLDRLDASPAELAVAVDAGRMLDAEAMKVTRFRSEHQRVRQRHRARRRARAKASASSASRAPRHEQLFDALDRTIASGRDRPLLRGCLLAADRAGRASRPRPSRFATCLGPRSTTSRTSSGLESWSGAGPDRRVVRWAQVRTSDAARRSEK